MKKTRPSYGTKQLMDRQLGYYAGSARKLCRKNAAGDLILRWPAPLRWIFTVSAAVVLVIAVLQLIAGERGIALIFGILGGAAALLALYFWTWKGTVSNRTITVSCLFLFRKVIVWSDIRHFRRKRDPCDGIEETILCNEDGKRLTAFPSLLEGYDTFKKILARKGLSPLGRPNRP